MPRDEEEEEEALVLCIPKDGKSEHALRAVEEDTRHIFGKRKTSVSQSARESLLEEKNLL